MAAALLPKLEALRVKMRKYAYELLIGICSGYLNANRCGQFVNRTVGKCLAINAVLRGFKPRPRDHGVIPTLALRRSSPHVSSGGR